MEPQERKNPTWDNALTPLANPKARWFGVILLALPALCLVSLGWLAESGALITGGVLVFVIPVAVMFLLPRTTTRTQPLSAYAQAEVIDRRREDSKRRWSGDWLDIIAALYYLIGRPQDHHVVLTFDAVIPNGDQRPVTVSALVSKKLYEQMAPGTTVLVQYAPDDPLRVRIEGELRWQEPADPSIEST